jgi:trehalose/maltose hydrolase-like predicted phosphorylase
MVEAFARAPYPLAGDLRIGPVSLSGSPGRGVLREQRYDFSCGELLTRIDFQAEGVRADVEILTFCSRTYPTVALQEIQVRVDGDCQLTMSAGVDPRETPGSCAERQVDGCGVPPAPVDGLLRWRSFGDLSSCGAAYITQFSGTDQVEQVFDHSRIGPVSTSYVIAARPGQRYRLRQMTSLVPDSLHIESHIQAARLVQSAQRRGFEALREENRAAWQELWKGRLVLAGAPERWQAFADAAFFYLQTSVHRSSPSSTSLFGLSYWPDYHYYRGHVMWDIETFAVPPLLLTHPEAARAILDYRRTRLPGARANAAMAGYRGVQYPWESSLRHGHEATPVDAPAPYVEHHASMDVGIAFARYVHATGDHEFALEALPVLAGVASWIASRVLRTPRGYEIHRVNGVAETKATVDNNAFVNMAAAVALREAVALSRALDVAYDPLWEEIAAGIVIPMDERKRVIHNHDGYDSEAEKGETPEAPAGLFPIGYDTDPETERRTLELYLRMADRYVGAPMLSAMLGVYAARLGDRAAALDLFEKGYADFIVEPYTITTEYSPSVYPDQPRAGPFTANLGGFLTSCLYGLTGLRLGAGEPASWCQRPVTMPAGWDGVHVERIWARCQPGTLTAEHGQDRARITM